MTDRIMYSLLHYAEKRKSDVCRKFFVTIDLHRNLNPKVPGKPFRQFVKSL